MAKTELFTCDYCGAIKKDANHWWVRDTKMRCNHTTEDVQLFVIIPWNSLDPYFEGVEHICSEACATKALSKWLGGASGNVVRPKELRWPSGNIVTECICIPAFNEECPVHGLRKQVP